MSPTLEAESPLRLLVAAVAEVKASMMCNVQQLTELQSIEATEKSSYVVVAVRVSAEAGSGERAKKRL